MPGEFTRHTVYNLVIASLIFLGGAFYSAASVQAQEQKQEQATAASEKESATSTEFSASIVVRDGKRYISGFGVPVHARSNPTAAGIRPSPYAFRVNAKPQVTGSPKDWRPGMFFGVALDGVPISAIVASYWEGNAAWPKLEKPQDQFGGAFIGKGTYVYNGIPAELVEKDLSHIGYAADGFPIFVSRNKKFTSGYRLNEGRRPKPPLGPGGVYDGQYLSDYSYVPGAGVLDRCNGIKVKNKYYIYVINSEAPVIPPCWSGATDPSFLKAPVVARPGGVSASMEGTARNDKLRNMR